MIRVAFPTVMLRPCSWNEKQQTYYGCIECLTPLEVRYCDGFCEPIWSMCSFHSDDPSNILDSYVDYDHVMLDFLRDNIYSQRIPCPPPSEVLEKIPDTNTRRLTKRYATWPHPKFEYRHADGCVHSGLPDTKLSPSLRLCLDAYEHTSIPSSNKKSKVPTLDRDLLARLQYVLSRGFLGGASAQSVFQSIEMFEAADRIPQLASNVYFRRCNGRYYNAYNQLWNPDVDNVSGGLSANEDFTPPTGKSSTENSPVWYRTTLEGTPDEATNQPKYAPLQEITSRLQELVVFRPPGLSPHYVPLNVLVGRETITADAEYNKMDLAMTMWSWHTQMLDNEW